LAIIAPFAERNAQAFGGLAGQLGRAYAAACEEAGTAPDTALLERIAHSIGNDEAIEALKAKIDSIFEAAEKTGALDGDALAELPAELAERIRAAWAEAQTGGGETGG
jgi:hypothetical protein